MPITNVSFYVRLYTAEPLADGKCPVVLQISWSDSKDHVRRKRLGISCYSEEFDNDNYRIKDTVWGYAKLNREIEEAAQKAENIYRKHFFDQPWNYSAWAQLFDDDGDTISSFDLYTKDAIEQLKATGRIKTAMYYGDCLKALQKFLRTERIEFNEITKSVLKNLEKNYILRGFKGDRTMRGLKAIYSKAVEDEVVDLKLMPFKTGYNPVGYKFTHLKKIKKKTNRIKRLSELQVAAIESYQPKNEGEEKAIDLWLFSYYTMGVELKDIAPMKRSHIRDGHWYYDRSKTDNSSLGKYLLPKCLDIIDKYDAGQNGYIFDFILDDGDDISDERFAIRIRDTLSNFRRRYIKISKALGFNGHFTFQSDRFTSSTISANRGADMSAVQQHLTHSSLTTTEIYTLFKNDAAMKQSLELLIINNKI